MDSVDSRIIRGKCNSPFEGNVFFIFLKVLLLSNALQ